MLKKENSYIIGLQGKDVYDRTITIKEGRKRVKTLDYSLETLKLEEVGQTILPNTKKDRLFYENEIGKQYTDSVISMSFNYIYYEYNKVNIGDDRYFVYYKQPIETKDIIKLEKEGGFSNGMYVEGEVIICMKMNSNTSYSTKQLPSGFKNEDGVLIEASNKPKVIANSKQIREKMYRDGFDVVFEGKNKVSKTMHFVRYKRSAGSARVGTCLFIWDKLYSKMMDWTRLGIKFKKGQNIDLAGYEAYISLTLSSIIDTMKIEPHNILVIDDYESVFNTVGMQVSEIQVDGKSKLTTEEKEFVKSNSIWDGQSLMDKSIFPNKYKNKGMLLLRQQFFKSACFNANIQQYFKDNNIKEVNQLNGYTLANKVEDIKLITTPSSIKFVKFGTLEHYLGRINNEFGIVKYEKPQKHLGGRGYVQTHYQLINTLQLSHEETKLFLKDTVEYIENLKSDFNFMKLHLKIREQECYLTGEENEDEFIFKMIQMNEDFRFTKMYKKFKEKLIASFIRNVLKGHVFVKGNYSTLLGNPIEMLQSSIGSFKGKSVIQEDTICCKEFKFEEELIGSRSPHPCSGNILLVKNCDKYTMETISEYINVTKEIVCINSIDNNILERLAGADMDSDTILLSNNRILIDSAKKNYNRFLVPTGEISSKKASRKDCYEDKLILDITANTDWIGVIINMTQILNSYIWQHIKNGEEKEAEALYVITSQLSVLSNLAIDSTKKNFNIDIQEELDEIKDKYIDCRLKPHFFSLIAKDKGNIVKKDKYVKMDTTMDYLCDIIESASRKKKSRKGDNFRDEGISISELMCRNTGNVKNRNRSTLDLITNKITESKKSSHTIWNSKNMPSGDKYVAYRNTIDELCKYIESKKLDVDTIKSIMYRFDKSIDEDIKKSYSLMYKTIYSIYPNEVTQLLKKETQSIPLKSFTVYEDTIWC